MAKFVRILIYEGSQKWIDNSLACRVVKDKQIFCRTLDGRDLCSITEVTFDQLINSHFQANVPQIYDISLDTFRPVTDKDIKLLQEKTNFAQKLMEKCDVVTAEIKEHHNLMNDIRRS